jgi:hypothetical protein
LFFVFCFFLCLDKVSNFLFFVLSRSLPPTEA